MINIFTYDNSKQTNLTPLIYEPKGEEEIYSQNIKQKKDNSSVLRFTINNKHYTFTNFGYDQTGDTIIFLILNTNSILIYNWKSNKLIGIFALPTSFIIHSDLFNYNEQRCFIKKYFTHLSFLKLNQNTNTLFVNEENNIAVISSIDRKMFYFIIITDNDNIDKNNNKAFCSYYYTLESLIHQITKYHIDIQTQLTIANIDDNIINKIISSSEIMIEASSYEFNRNYSLIITEDTNHNGLNNVNVYLIFYVVDIKQLKQSFLIYQLRVNPGDSQNDLLKYSGLSITISINEGCSMIQKRKIESIISKIGIFNGDSYCINIVSFNNNYFELIVINLRLLFYKRLSSVEWLNKIDIGQIRNNNPFISDIFLIENEGKIIIVMNFLNVFILTIETFTFELFSIDNRVSYHIDLNKIFKGEYSKCLFVSLKRMNEQYKPTKKERDICYQMIIKTKKETKCILLLHDQYRQIKDNGISQKTYIIKSDISESTIPLPLIKNRVWYYNHLQLICNLYHSWKNNNFKSYGCFNYNYICSLYEHNARLLLDVFNNKVYQLNIINYLLMKNHSGIFLSYFQQRLSTIKYKYFLHSLDFTHIKTLFFKDLNLKTDDGINDESESNACIIPTYDIVLTNNFMLHYFIYLLLVKLLDEKRNMKEISILINGSINNKSERLHVYSILKRFLHKQLHHCNDYDFVMPFDHQINYLNEIRRGLKKTNSHIVLFDLIKKSYKYKDLGSIASLTFFILLKYLTNSHSCKFTFSKFYLKDIILSLRNNYNDFEQLHQKFFTKKSKSRIKINISSNQNITDYFVIFIYFYFNKRCQLMNYSSSKLLCFISLLEILNDLLLKDKTIQINEKLFNSNHINQNDYIESNQIDKWRQKINQNILQLIIAHRDFQQTQSYRFLLFSLSIKANIANYQRLLIENYHLFINKNIESNVFELLSIISKNSTTICQMKTKIHNETQITFNYVFDLIMSDDTKATFHNSVLSSLWNKLLLTLQTSFYFINYTLRQSKSNSKDFFNYLMKSNKQNKDTNAAMLYLRLAKCFKEYIALLYFALSLIHLICIYNKAIEINNSEGIIMCQSLMILSFYNRIKFPDTKSLYENEIIDYVYYSSTLNIINYSFFSVFFLYNCIKVANSIQQSKIDDIIQYVKCSNNGSFNSLLALNKKKEAFIQSITSGPYSISKYQSVFSFINNNDSLFDYFLLNIRDTLCNKTLSSRSIAKQYKQYSNEIRKESNEVFEQLNQLLDFKQMLTSDQIVYDSTKDEIKDKKILASNIKIIEKIINQGHLNKRLSTEYKQELSTREQEKQVRPLELEEIELKTKDRSSLIDVIENTYYIQRNKSELTVNNDKVNSGFTRYTDDSQMKPNSAATGLKKRQHSRRVERINKQPIKKEKNEQCINKPETTENISFRNTLSENQFKKKYISIKLMIRILNERQLLIQDIVFKLIKAQYYINSTNTIVKQINLELKQEKDNSIRSSSVISEQNDLPLKLLGRNMYPKLKINPFYNNH